MSAESAARGEDASAPTGTGAPETAGPDAGSAFSNVLAAGAALLQALRRAATALAALLASETRVLRASVALVFLGSVALIAFSVSLWACTVALIGWGLVLATGSIGIALGLLVVLHLVLVAASWFVIKRAIHHASFSGTRTELRALGGELRAHVQRFQRASTSHDADDAP